MVWSTDLAKWILEFIDYGVVIIFILMAIEIFRAITGEKGGEKIAEAGGGLWERLKKVARREKKRLLSEYIEEEKGFKLLDKLEDSTKDALAEIEPYQKGKAIDNEKKKKDLVEAIEAVGKNIEETEKEFGRIISRTRRQERAAGKLIKKLEESGVETTELKVFERGILKLHGDIRQELENAGRLFDDKLNPLITGLTKTPLTDLTVSKCSYEGSLVGLSTLLGNGASVLEAIKTQNIDTARKKQDEVIKLVDGIIAKNKELFK